MSNSYYLLFHAGAFTDDAFDDCLDPIDSLNVNLEKLPSVAVKHLQSSSTNGNYFNGSQLSKLKKKFLSCCCHEIYRVEAVGLTNDYYS